MSYKVNMDDFEGVAESFDTVLDELDETLRTALEISASEVARIAKGTTTFTDRSGALRSSMQPDPEGPRGNYAAGTLEMGVGFGATSEDGFPYGLALEYGSKAHVIAPKFRTTLRIPVEGGFLFRRRVMHPGTQELGFMRDALEQAGPIIEELVADAVELAFARAGFTR